MVGITRVGDRLAQARQDVNDYLSGKKSPEPDPFVKKYFGTSSFMEAYLKCLAHIEDEQYLTEEEIEEGKLEI